VNDNYDQAILRLYWQQCLNTKEIADRLKLEEHQVERRLHYLKDEAFKKRSDAN
jgi:DNA-directed RNA polymerase specialized sigma subunit